LNFTFKNKIKTVNYKKSEYPMGHFFMIEGFRKKIFSETRNRKEDVIVN
jgi:hypothetical protein